MLGHAERSRLEHSRLDRSRLERSRLERSRLERSSLARSAWSAHLGALSPERSALRPQRWVGDEDSGGGILPGHPGPSPMRPGTTYPVRVSLTPTKGPPWGIRVRGNIEHVCFCPFFVLFIIWDLV